MKLGFIGAGAMGGAIIKGAISSGVIKASDVYVSEKSDAMASKVKEMGCNLVSSNAELGKLCDIVVSAVKPQYYKSALKELGDTLNGKALISIMAGIKKAAIREIVGDKVRILRLMPNTPALVSMGTFALDSENNLNPDEKEFAERLFSSIGIVEWMSESLIDTATGLSGAGPAYVYLFIEALADGGVLEGLPRATALKLAAETVMGAANMVLKTGEHPGKLKDNVCSPGGNTIVGVKTLEEHGFRGAVIDCVSKATIKARELGNN